MKIKSQPVGKPFAKAKPREHVNPLLAAAGESEEESEEEGPAKHTGTLKIDERGTSTYFGSTARSEVCFFLQENDNFSKIKLFQYFLLVGADATAMDSI